MFIFDHTATVGHVEGRSCTPTTVMKDTIALFLVHEGYSTSEYIKIHLIPKRANIYSISRSVIVNSHVIPHFDDRKIITQRLSIILTSEAGYLVGDFKEGRSRPSPL